MKSLSTLFSGLNSGPAADGGLERLVTAYAAWVIRWRWGVIALILAAALVVISGARNIGFSTDYRVFFSAENPYLKAFDANQNIYTKDDNILLVVVPQKGDVFEPSVLAALRDLTEAAWKVPFATRVDGVTNFQNSTAEGDDIIVQSLVPKTGPIRRVAAQAARTAAMNEPLLVGRLVSRDGASTAINISLSLPQKELDEIPKAMEYVSGLVEKFSKAHPDIRVATTGMVALNNAFVASSIEDLTFLIPLMYVAMILGIAIVLRSLAGTIATVTIVALSSGVAMGTAGWFDVLINPASATVPIIVTTIAVADSIHILISVLRETRNGATREAAIVESLRINFNPVFLTSLTTLIGFLSLNASDAPPFHDLGNLSAVGVVAAWILSISLLPALLAVLPVRSSSGAKDQV
ncbi:MAG: MMPL family transporter, partial [Rhodospirillales bacterium]|nr:MMPL family transporter [Rhodospirillales bacterium]